MKVSTVSPFKGASQQPTRCSYRRQAAENDVSLTMKSGKLHFLALAFTIALNGAGGLEIIRTQIRPAIEFVSGEEGPRPALLLRLFYRCVRLRARPEVHNGPWLLLWSRGEEGAVLLWHRSFCEQCHVSLLPVT